MRRPGLVAGALLVVLLLVAAALSYLWTPWPPLDMAMAARLQPPSPSHWMGTDAYGRDLASQVMVGARASIAVGVVAVAIGLIAGSALGLLAAARRGWVEDLVMRLTDIGLAFPALLTAVVLAAVQGPGIGNAMLAIGLYNVPSFARIARAGARAVWSRDYVRAARATGRGRWAITFAHVLPNVAPLLVVQATVRLGIAILAEAALSYLGLGTQPPMPSWGRLLSEAQSLMSTAPWLAVFPGAAIALAVLGVNLFGDGLRDLLDPRLRQVDAPISGSHPGIR
ncbi:ABC transporter permease [Xylophilus sp. GOD-11R]|uniref:ABC transporter permease n=1 Tax=Xylophilus sp. GOD-11R TaxID=3089814 RepID=UPI00298D10A0|nr:ABC transporter permease [Xylophilus sp. GOD-11R]WPB55287.1 ABC transporter permease [Xylophilus sp. GOD-11R]